MFSLRKICGVSIYLTYSVGTGLVLLEIVCRFFAPNLPTSIPLVLGPSQFVQDDVLGNINTPGQRGFRHWPGVYYYEYSNNSMGLRASREISAIDDEHRILILGDSFTYGYGVNDDQTFCALLERNLGGENHVLFNAGHGGKGTDFALAFVRRHMDSIKPNIVLHCPYSNDISDNSYGNYFHVRDDSVLVAKNLPQSNVLKKTLERNAVYNWAISYSYAAALLKQAAISFLVNSQRQTVGDTPEMGTLIAWYRGTVDVEDSGTGRYLQELATFFGEKEAISVVCYIPSTQDFVSSDNPDELQAELVSNNLCQRLGIRFHSFTKSLRDSGVRTDELYFSEGRWTARVHTLVAGDLLRLFEPFTGKG